MLLALAMMALEMLARPPLTGFVTGYQATNDGSSILEQVPKGESVDHWTRMVTTQRFAKVADRVDAEGFLQLMVDGLDASCPGSRVSDRRTDGGTAQLRADCPLNPQTGLPETFFAKALPGETDMHVAQVAFHRVPTAEDVAWAEHYLTTVTLKP